MQISGQDMERVKAMKGGRERGMDELWRNCGELHYYTWLYQSYFTEKESAYSLTDSGGNRVRNKREQLTSMQWKVRVINQN